MNNIANLTIPEAFFATKAAVSGNSLIDAISFGN